MNILDRQEYLGHTVNFKTRKKSYKLKKTIKNAPSEWQIFKDTHEAIISEDTFQTVKRIRDGRRRPTPLGEMPVLSGMVFCADCGSNYTKSEARDGAMIRSTWSVPTIANEARTPVLPIKSEM